MDNQRIVKSGDLKLAPSLRLAQPRFYFLSLIKISRNILTGLVSTDIWINQIRNAYYEVRSE